MRIGLNQFCWPSGTDVADTLAKTKALGYECFEVCMTAGRAPAAAGGGVTDALDIAGYYNRLLHEGSPDEDFHQLARLAQEAGLPISSVGGVMTFSLYPLTAKDKTTAQKAMDSVKRMADAARIVGADTLLIIPGLLDEHTGYEEGFARAQRRVADLAAYAGEGLTLAIENVWNNMLYSPLELNRFVDEIDADNVGLYFDIANARRFGYPQQWIRTMGHRIKKLHIKDYRMSIDNINGFTNILDGDVDWPAVMSALTDIGYDGDLVVELIPPAHTLVKHTLHHALQTLKALCAKTASEEPV